MRNIAPGDRPLRFVVFGESIVSDVGNPVATSARAVLAALAEEGHEVTFQEERGNAAYLRLLKLHGSRGARGFAARYPRVQCRTYDLPRGWERTVWVGREAGTADAVIALPGTPPSLLLELTALPSRHIVRFIDESLDIEHDGFRLVRAQNPASDLETPFGPAVQYTSRDLHRHTRPVVVAYDDMTSALRVVSQLSAGNPLLITSGLVVQPGWDYVPEIELPDIYSQHETAIVVADDDSRWALARHLLPIASGCATPDLSNEMQFSTPQIPFSAEFDAMTQASGIIKNTRRALLRT